MQSRTRHGRKAGLNTGNQVARAQVAPLRSVPAVAKEQLVKSGPWDSCLMGADLPLRHQTVVEMDRGDGCTAA